MSDCRFGVSPVNYPDPDPELPAESTDVKSDNVIQRYSKRPRQLQNFCLADYVSNIDVIYPKGNKLPEKIEERNDDVSCKVVLAMKVKTVLKMKMMVMTVIVPTCCTEQRMEQNIRKEKYLE